MLVCAVVPSFPLAVALRHAPEPAARAMLIVDAKERVVALTERARAAGACVGMTLTQARAHAPDARITLDDPAERAAVWNTALDAWDAVSPCVEDAAEGTAFLDLRGVAGTPARWMADVRDRVAPLGLRPLTGTAAGKFVARAVTAMRDGGVCVRGGEAAFLAPLPVTLLALDAPTTDRLLRLGVRTLGDLAALPYGPFVRRFGAAAARWHDLASGRDDIALTPRALELPIAHDRQTEDGISDEAQVLFALRELIARAAADLARTGRRCAALRVVIRCDDGSAHDLSVAIAQPTARERALEEIVRARVADLRCSAPVVGVRVVVERSERGGDGGALQLFIGDDAHVETVGVLLARLHALGVEPRRLRVTSVRWRERGAVDEAFTATAAPPRDDGSEEAARPCEPGADAVPQYRPFAAPVAVRVVVRADAPIEVDGLAVASWSGPARMDEPWWSDAPLRRDAYDVALDDGSIRRIVHERPSARWTQHGIYD